MKSDPLFENNDHQIENNDPVLKIRSPKFDSTPRKTLKLDPVSSLFWTSVWSLSTPRKTLKVDPESVHLETPYTNICVPSLLRPVLRD
jgi:hypothetical protein